MSWHAERAIARALLAQAWREFVGPNTFAFPSSEWFIAENYLRWRQLPDGRWLAVQNMLFTTALLVDVTALSWRRRFCYEDPAEAVLALEEWDGMGDPPDPPGMWIKEKPGDRMNPRWLAAAKRELGG